MANGGRKGGAVAARERARARAAEQRAAEQRATRRRRRLLFGGGTTALVVVIAVVVALVATRPGSPAARPEGIAVQQGTVLAGRAHAGTGAPVDGIRCDAAEGQVEHIHTHLAVYVAGKLRPIPAGIGVVQPVAQGGGKVPFYGASTCYYWLHVHTQDGVVHVEAPASGTYTLGQFFAVWGQPLSRTDVAGATGTVTAFVNGKPFTGDPASIALGSREDVQLDVGTVVAPQPVDWSQSQL